MICCVPASVKAAASDQPHRRNVLCFLFHPITTINQSSFVLRTEALKIQYTIRLKASGLSRR